MTIATVGLLHPGAMGVTVGAAVRESVRVVWASRGVAVEEVIAALLGGPVACRGD